MTKQAFCQIPRFAPTRFKEIDQPSEVLTSFAVEFQSVGIEPTGATSFGLRMVYITFHFRSFSKMGIKKLEMQSRYSIALMAE